VSRSGPEGKPFVIPKQLVWEAYRRVKANKGAAGVDRESVAGFESDLRSSLYKIWNRMSSGTYFPPPVMAVEIPKASGGTRMPGVPTVADRVAQTVAAMALEARTESIFHEDSYGYRPRRGALDALAKCRQRCWKKDWVIDLDVQKFFGSVPWDLMVKAVEANITTGQKWVLLYVRRWLAAPLQLPDGTLQQRDRGTPQGSAVSPVLANLFMHYASGLFLAREFPGVEFERYADDAVVHCASEQEARVVLAALASRMEEVGLRLHPAKTKIVYCKDDRRRGSHEHTLFTFLGYTFRPRGARSRREDVHGLPARGQPRRAQEDGPAGPPVADPHVDRSRPERDRRAGQPGCGGLDELLRPVLPVAAVSPPAARQHLPDALGRQEIQAAARLQEVHTVVDRGDRTGTPAVRPLGLDARACRIAMRRAE
jgi:RNA-directed DNA polymerase